MRIYKLSECCTLFGVNPKTFHEWLKQEGILLQAVRADRRVRCLTQEQVDHLTGVYGKKAAARGEPSLVERLLPVADRALGERLDQVEQRLSLLEDEIRRCNEILSAVQQQMETLTVPPVQASAEPVEPPPSRERAPVERRPPGATRAKKKQRGKHLPRALVLLRVFAEQHQISMKQASAAGQSGKFTVVRGKWLVNSRWATEALDQRGQQEFYEAFHLKAGFLRCDHCPHDSAR